MWVLGYGFRVIVGWISSGRGVVGEPGGGGPEIVGFALRVVGKAAARASEEWRWVCLNFVVGFIIEILLSIQPLRLSLV